MKFRNKEHYPDPTAYEALSRVSSEEKMKAWKPCVFICSPFAGDESFNIEQAKKYMRFAIDKGCIPFAPHLLYPQVLEDTNSDERELGLTYGLIWLGKCDELWVFGDVISTGMEREIAKAERRSMPIFYYTAECKEVTSA